MGRMGVMGGIGRGLPPRARGGLGRDLFSSHLRRLISLRVSSLREMDTRTAHSLTLYRAFGLYFAYA